MAQPPGHQDQYSRVGFDRFGRELVEAGSEFKGFGGVLFCSWRAGQDGRRLICVTGSQQQLERGAGLAPPPVSLRRPGHGVHALRCQGGQVVADGTGQVPPGALGGGERDARFQGSLEEFFVLARDPGEFGIAQGEPRHLGQGRTARRSQGQKRFFQNGGHGAGRVTGTGGGLGYSRHRFTGPGRPGRGQDGSCRPAPRRLVERRGRRRAHIEAEPGAAQRQGLRRVHSQVGRRELEVLGSPQAAGPGRQPPGQEDETLLSLQRVGQMVDQCPRLGFDVVGIVEHERAVLGGQGRHQGVEQLDRVLFALGRRRGLGEPGPAHSLVKTSGQ